MQASQVSRAVAASIALAARRRRSSQNDAWLECYPSALRLRLQQCEIGLEGVGRNGMVSLVEAVAGRDLAPAPGPVNRLLWRESTAGPQSR